MEWHHFEYFKILAEVEHMTNAAKKLSVSQSALSRAIKKIEDELQVPLFDRRGRSIHLNKFGKEFLITTNKIMNEIENVKNKIQEMSGIETGEVTLGFLHTVGSTYLSQFIHQFRIEHPKVDIKLVQNNSKTLIELLRDGIIDICLTSVVSVEKPIKWHPLLTEALYVTVSTNHRFGNKQRLYIEDLIEEKFILLKEGFALRTLTDEIFDKFKIAPLISFEGEEIHTIASFISAELGISLLPKLKNLALTNIVQIPIANHDINTNRIIGVCWNEESVETKIIKELKESIISYFNGFSHE